MGLRSVPIVAVTARETAPGRANTERIARAVTDAGSAPERYGTAAKWYIGSA